ncbi:PLDc_N domain-containing protein [Frigoribacterium sp. CFBP 8751]|nr:PLDc_N domain-containing protein [Frigoribacterium sp. CFBP 8751]
MRATLPTVRRARHTQNAAQAGRGHPTSRGFRRADGTPYPRAVTFVLAALPLLLIVGALVDIVTRPEGDVRHLPKGLWIMIVLFLPLIGSIVWFAAGREYGRRVEQIGPRDQSRYHEAAARTLDHRVRSTEQQLADLDREAEHYERLARLAKLEAEVEQRRSTAGDDVPA